MERKVSLGQPAEQDDLIVSRRVNLTKQIPDFCNEEMTLADVGCGNGASTFLLASGFKKVVGLEVVSAYEKEFNEIKKSRDITNCVFRIFNLDQDKVSEQFDRVICFEVVEHLEEESSVKTISALLKPGGKAVFSVPNKWWIFETHGAKLPLLKWNRVPFFSWLPTRIHERFARARIYTKKRIAKVLQNSGLTIVRMQYIIAPMDVVKNRSVNKVLRYLLFRGDTTVVPMMATSIFVEVEKPL